MRRFTLNCEVPAVVIDKALLGADDDVHAQVIALEFYPGSVPTFTIMSNSGHLFAYVPPNAFVFPPSCHRLNEEFTDIECPNSEPSVSVLPIWEQQGWGRIGKVEVEWRRYICSVDWSDENLLLHCVLLKDGTFAFLRNSRFQVGGESWEPPAWKKLRSEWHLIDSAVCVIVQRDDLFLAVSRRDNSEDFGLPAGKIENGETSLEAVLREFSEETGMGLESALLLDQREYGGRQVYCYLADAIGELKQQPGEGVVKWATKAELYAGTFGNYNKAVLEAYMNCQGQVRDYRRL